MKSIQRTLIALLLAFGLIGAAQAEVIKSLSNEEVETIVSVYTNGNYNDLEDGDFGFELAGAKVILFHSGKSMQLYAGFRHSSSLESMNEWNKGKRFSRANLDDENDPVLESDQDLEGGASIGAVREFIDTFALSVKAFRDHIGYNEEKPSGSGMSDAELERAMEEAMRRAQ